jgi:Bacterial pre-peptidase C-terminal domain
MKARLPFAIESRLPQMITLGLTVIAVVLYLSHPLAAQTPASGSVSSSSPGPINWCGGTATFPNCSSVLQTSATTNPLAATCGNSKCETFTLTVGAANSGDLVKIRIDWTNSANDFDLHVFDSNGNEIATSAGGPPSTTEQVTIPAVAGTYSVKALFYAVVADNYTGTATLQAAPSPRAATYVTGGITFSANVSVRAPAAAADGEPSSRVDFQGNAYTSGIRGVPAGVDLWAFDANKGSMTFDPELRHPHYRGQPDSFPESQALDVGADGGGDVDLAVGFQLPGNPFSTVPNLTAVSLVAANISSARSQDRGMTFMNDPAANLIPADDRQWLEALGGDVEFLLYRAPIPATGLFVQTSTDGGLTFAPTSTSVVNTSGTTPGYISVDQTRQLVYAGHSSSTAMFVSRAQFDAMNPLLPMTFRRFTVDNTTSHRHLFDVVKVDRGGVVYACWSDDKNIYLASSEDQGQTWSQKVQVNNPNFTVLDRFGTSQTVQVNLFPWCEAGSGGRVDVVWYGTTNPKNDDNADWNVFFAQVQSATSATPTIQQVKASDHFIHGSNISEGGLTGAANRNLLDYFQVSLDPQGAAFISFADDHNDFTGHTFVARQLDGPSAFANIGTVAAVAPTPPPAQDPTAPQVIDFVHDAVAGLLAVIPTDHPLDILSIRYGCETTADNRTLVTATMKVSDLSTVPSAANWRMNFTANAAAGLVDRGDQLFLRASTDTVTPTFTFGTTARNSDGSLTNTTRGSADAGFFNTADKAITVKVDIAKLNPFVTHGPLIGQGTSFMGLRGSTFTTGVNAIRDIARGGAVPIGDSIQGAFSGGIGDTQFTISACSPTPPPPPPPPPPGTQKTVSISGGGSIGPNGKDNNFGFNADNRPAGHLLYQDKGNNIDLVSMSVDFFEPPLTATDTCVSFGGKARLNGDPGHIFTVKACDNGEPGKGTDTFEIHIDANYSRNGTLTQGNIQLHEK